MKKKPRKRSSLRPNEAKLLAQIAAFEADVAEARRGGPMPETDLGLIALAMLERGTPRGRLAAATVLNRVIQRGKR